jgi:deazaflavin-dependent oxidoreductase (nitroreductase family)
MALTGDYEPSGWGWVREHVEQIVRTGTTDGVMSDGLPIVLMTYRGAKTGKVRKTPVRRVEHQGRYAAVASNGGAPTNPQWYASLVIEPVIELQDGAVTRAYHAREVFGDEKGTLVAPGGGGVPELCRLPAQYRPPDPGLRARTGQRGDTGPLTPRRPGPPDFLASW